MNSQEKLELIARAQTAVLSRLVTFLRIASPNYINERRNFEYYINT